MPTPNTPGWLLNSDWDEFAAECERVLMANRRRPKPIATLPPEHYESEESDEMLEVGAIAEQITKDHR